MSRSRWHVILALAAVLAMAAAAQAQQFTPRIGYVYPAGGRQGSAFQVTVGGQFLGPATGAYVSGAGVQTTFVEYNRPLSQKEFNDLRDRLKELQPKDKDAATLKEIADIRAKILKNPPNRQGNPAIAETVTLTVTLAADAEPGDREVRLVTPAGLTNPLLFCVGQLPEFAEPPAKVPNPDVERFKAGLGRRAGAAPAPAKAETTITLPAVVNGQIMPGVVDRYRFQARKGQRLVVAASARRLIPYLPDAVPGWFQATLSLYDAAGKELAYDDDYRFNPDPVLFYEIRQDGEYVVEIKDAIYRGREDFIYRIALGELPFVTGIFPLGGPAGAQTKVTLRGWNLPVTQLTPAVQGAGVYPISVRQDNLISNSVPFAADTLPERLESEPNNLPAKAMPVTLPLIVNGRIDPPDDWDVFRFEGRAGTEIVADVEARRLDSPLDSVLKVTDAAGKQLALNDDHEDKGAGLATHHADSCLIVRLPADGTYYVHLGDAQHKGGPEYAYRLRLGPPQPDFELRVVPSAINVRGGASVPITVYALRKDGFTGEIAVVLKDAPKGFVLNGAQVPANQDRVCLTLTVPPAATTVPLSLSIEGRATIQGRDVSRPAVPAEDMMQAFAYRHLVPAREMKVVVSGRNMARFPTRILGDSPLKIPVGGTVRVQVALPAARAFGDKLQLELSEPPEGIAIKNVSPSGEGTEIVFQCDAKAKPGLKGNLIVNAFAPPPAAAAGKPAAANPRRAPLGVLPAIPFEIVSP